MELKSFDTSAWENGIELIIKDLEGKDTDVTFTIKYLESSAGKKARLDYGRKIMALKEEGKELSEVTNQDDFLELLIALIVDFKGLKENGKEVKFSKEKCLEILKAYPFITSQIDVAVGNSKLFLQK